MRIIMLSLIFSICSQASTETKKYQIAGKSFSFQKMRGLYVSGECDDGCMAISNAKQLKSLPKQKDGFFKPKASLICEASGGKAVFGVDHKKNMMAFCLYSDKSLVEYRSLEGLKIE